MAGLVGAGLVVVDFVVVAVTGLVLVHLLFLPCLSHIIFNLALSCNPLILFYHTIYFLNLSTFILSYLLIISSIHFFALPSFFWSNISGRGNFKVFAFSKFNLSLMLEFDDPLLIYSSCLIFSLFDILGDSYEVYLGFLLSYFWNPR